MGGNFKFQVQDSFLEYFFREIWRFKKQIALSEEKPPLVRINVNHIHKPACVELTKNELTRHQPFAFDFYKSNKARLFT